MPAQARTLTAQAQRGGEAGRVARERLARSDVVRPPGPVVWIHAPEGTDLAGAASLRARIADQLPDVTLLVTHPTGSDAMTNVLEEGVVVQEPPLDSPSIVARFLDHWTPDVAVWLGQVSAPILADASARRGITMFLQNATAPEINSPRGRALQQRLLGLFERILALDAIESDRIRAIGSIPSRIETTGALAPVADPPPCVESEREILAEALNTRPVWLAAWPDPEEIDTVVAAHLFAQRTTHRLLLIIATREPGDGPLLAETLTARGWDVVRRTADEEPGDRTDIFLVDDPEELGLCYRLAPVTFLGGTLSGGPVPDPMGPATLGSAVITGPRTGAERAALSRLCNGGACRRVNKAEDLGSAVSGLLAPDQAAMLALNAWNIASEGAQVLARLASLVVTALRARSY